MLLPVIYLWEFAPSPHLGNVLQGLAKRGYLARYMVHSKAYGIRKSLGWIEPDLRGVEVVQVHGRDEINGIVTRSHIDDVHICVGLRGNDYVRNVAALLRKARRPFWVFMETINERRWFSGLKRPLYRYLFARNRPWLAGVLAAGATTSQWVVDRGVPKERVFDFAYFLKGSEVASVSSCGNELCFRLLFVGSLVPLKRVHLLIGALKDLPAYVVLDIVGDGPLRERLEAQAKVEAPERVTFHGTRPMPEIASFMASADCLVLPSDHDGWGAVISEALIAGTRVVCSDRCGASVVVCASGAGRVFETFTQGACAAALRDEVEHGPVDDVQRMRIADWAHCLTDAAGAAYLEAIIAHVRNGTPRPLPPWSEPKLKSGKHS